jgi:hypothetical protein
VRDGVWMDLTRISRSWSSGMSTSLAPWCLGITSCVRLGLGVCGTLQLFSVMWGGWCYAVGFGRGVGRRAYGMAFA